MREKINRLAKGIVDDITPLISVEPKVLEAEFSASETTRFELLLQSQSNIYIKGLAYSSDSRVKVIPASFGGEQIRLNVEIVESNRPDTSVLEGEISLVTNGGEFVIPYCFTCKGTAGENALASLRTIEDFIYLVKEDKKTALRAFEYKNFCDAPFMQDPVKRTIYRALNSKANKTIAFNQFMKAIGYDDSIETTEPEEQTEEQDKNVSYYRTESQYIAYKKHFANYTRLRLNFEMNHGINTVLINEMCAELEALSVMNKRPELIALLRAEAEFLRNDITGSCTYIDSVENIILNNRNELLEEYFLLEYLKVVIYHKYDKAASLIRLCRKFIEEEKMTGLFFYVIKLDGDLVSRKKEYKDFLENIFYYGSRSPYLYYYYCRFLNENSEYLAAPSKFEAQALNFGKKYGILEDAISRQVLSASCISYIKMDKRNSHVHKEYAKAIDNGLNISGLFEYYLYSFDPSSEEEISDKVLEHYAESDNLDNDSKVKLYSSILRYKNPNTGLYKAYIYRIEKFAIEQLKSGAVNRKLSYIYDKTLRPDMFDSSIAQNLPALVNSYLFTFADPRLNYVIVLYPQLSSEESYHIVNKESVVPLFSEDAIVLTQDVAGNRYFDSEYSKEKIINNQILIREVDRTYQDTPYNYVKKVCEILNKKSLSPDDVLSLETSLSTLPLSNDYKSKVIHKLIKYYNEHTAQGYNPDFLLKVNKNSLGNEERKDLTNAYIVSGCTKEAFEMIKLFGSEGIDIKNLKNLISKLILDNMFSRDPVLLDISYMVFDKNMNDNIILDYLCENYNGPTDNMFKVLSKAVPAHIETYDLEERLLAQILFSGNYAHLSQVFEWYATRKKASENIVKAYFTVVSFRYFIGTQKYDSTIFNYLENAVKNSNDVNGIPTIYQLALSKRYSELEQPDSNQLRLSEMFVKNLISQGIIFPYFKSFTKYFELPSSIENSQIISYNRGQNDDPVLYTRVTPSDAEWQVENFDTVYLNQYVKSKVLFSGEKWSYRIKDAKDSRILASGEMTGDTPACSHSYNMFKVLNEISTEYTANNTDSCISKMSEFISTRELIQELFKIQ